MTPYAFSTVGRSVSLWFVGYNLGMYYVYVLQSLSDRNFYTGFANNLENRIKKHDNGSVEATKFRRPLKLVYYEACINKKDALSRELYLKTAWGKRFIKNRIKRYLENGGPG